jgi:hypothetical protein
MQHGTVRTTLDILRQAYNLLDRYEEVCGNDSGPSWLTEIVCPYLARQAVLFVLFGEALPSSYYDIVKRWLSCDISLINSLAAARNALYATILTGFELIEKVSLAKQAGGTVNQSILDRQSVVLEELRLWQARVDQLAIRSNLAAQERATYHTLSCNQRVATIWLQQVPAMFQDPQPVDDSRFVEILHHADAATRSLGATEGVTYSIPLTFELGIVPPLFFVGWQCRSLGICRQAVSLMRRAPWQENLFVTALQINALEKIIAIKEGSTKKLAECEAFEAARLPAELQGRSVPQVVSKCSSCSAIFLKADIATLDRSLALPRPQIFG